MVVLVSFPASLRTVRSCWLLVCAFFVVLCTAEARSEDMRYAGAEFAPWILRGSDGEVHGICPDVLRAVMAAVGRDVSMRVVPKQRYQQDFAAGLLDGVICSSLGWEGAVAGSALFAEAIATARNVVLMLREDKRQVNTVADLKGMRVGVGAGYYYAEGLQALMQSGAVRREDGQSSVGNLQKLLAGRVDAVVLDHVEAGWVMLHQGIDPARVRVAYAFQEAAPVSIILSMHHADMLVPVNDALEKLRKAGSIDTVLRRYTVGLPLPQLPSGQVR